MSLFLWIIAGRWIESYVDDKFMLLRASFCWSLGTIGLPRECVWWGTVEYRSIGKNGGV